MNSAAAARLTRIDARLEREADAYAEQLRLAGVPAQLVADVRQGFLDGVHVGVALRGVL